MITKTVILDISLFILGLLASAVGAFVSGWPVIAATVTAALASGAVDGRTSPRLRPIGCWLPALLGSVSLLVYALAAEFFRDPPAPDGGVAISILISILAVSALVFVAVAIACSVFVRRLRRRQHQE